MSEFDRKYAAAQAEIEAAGIWRSQAFPIGHRIMRKIGFRFRPPHYTPGWQVILSYGIFFALTWGALMWLFVWRSTGMPLSAAINFALIAGTVFGVLMSIYYAISRAKHGLSNWDIL